MYFKGKFFFNILTKISIENKIQLLVFNNQQWKEIYYEKKFLIFISKESKQNFQEKSNSFIEKHNLITNKNHSFKKRDKIFLLQFIKEGKLLSSKRSK